MRLETTVISDKPDIYSGSTRDLKTFFCGVLGGVWRSGRQRCDCLRELGCEVVPFDQHDYLQRALRRNRLFRLARGYYDEQALSQFNQDVLAALIAARPQVAWFEWPFLLKRETLLEAASRMPDCVMVSFQDDNPFGSRLGELRRWQHFLEAIPAYDLHFLKRPADLIEFHRREARRTELFRHGFYAPLFHHIPDPGFCGSRQEVSFVGTALDNRVQTISELLVRHQIPLQIYGNRWHRTLIYHRRKKCFHPAVVGEDYVRVIHSSRICLGFVSSSNGDEYTMRTFEIPACGGFLLAERTPTHQELFVEGQEAEFFASTDECADKIRFYLSHETSRARIAERGHQRCLASDYSLRRSLTRALEQIESVFVQK
jgi:hypothetical protein